MRHCPRCGNPVAPASLDRMSVEDAPLNLTVSGMPVARCANGHAAPVDRDFMLWLLQELKERAGSLAGGEEKGLVFKKYFCACGAELAAKPARRHAFPFDLTYAGLPAFRAELELPLYKCAACGKEQLRSAKAARSHIPPAVVALNDAAGFPHSA